MLATYPNFHVDIAARLSELGRQSRAARALMLAPPDRVLFGPDIFPAGAATCEVLRGVYGDNARRLIPGLA